MNALYTNGTYTVDGNTLKILHRMFVGGFADEKGVYKTILDVYDRTDHLIDTHTAVGFNIYNRYHQRSGEGYSNGRSNETVIAELAEESGLEIRHTDVIDKEDMEEKVRQILLG